MTDISNAKTGFESGMSETSVLKVVQKVSKLNTENLKLKADLLEARDLIMDLFNQACKVGSSYDHQCMSTYEEAQRCLLEWRMLTEEECIRK